MAVTKLQLYNNALRFLGETRLSTLTDRRPIRFELDELYDSNARQYCLEQGLWNFAIRSTQASSDPDVNPDFGHQYAFSKPTDWVRTAALCTDEFFKSPLLTYEDEGTYWFTDSQDTLYVKYVSNDASWGLDLARWPPTFDEAVACYFAYKLAPSHTKSEKKIDRLGDMCEKAFRDARSKDAINDPTKFFAVSNWVASRRGPRGRSDRGNTASLTG
jgi:hypothetical protein